MPGEAEQPIRNELAPGETLLWSGMPAQGVKFHPIDLLLVPFSLMWGGFAVSWEKSAIEGRAPLLFLLWGIPFVAVAVYITVGRFFADAWRRSRTFYGVTNQRAIIIGGLWKRTVTSIELKTLENSSFSERANGSGTIRLGPGSPFSGIFAGSSWPGGAKYVAPSFERIADVRKVYELIRFKG